VYLLVGCAEGYLACTAIDAEDTAAWLIHAIEPESTIIWHSARKTLINNAVFFWNASRSLAATSSLTTCKELSPVSVSSTRTSLSRVTGGKGDGDGDGVGDVAVDTVGSDEAAPPLPTEGADAPRARKNERLLELTNDLQRGASKEKVGDVVRLSVSGTSTTAKGEDGAIKSRVNIIFPSERSSEECVSDEEEDEKTCVCSTCKLVPVRRKIDDSFSAFCRAADAASKTNFEYSEVEKSANGTFCITNVMSSCVVSVGMEVGEGDGLVLGWALGNGVGRAVGLVGRTVG